MWKSSLPGLANSVGLWRWFLKGVTTGAWLRTRADLSMETYASLLAVGLPRFDRLRIIVVCAEAVFSVFSGGIAAERTQPPAIVWHPSRIPPGCSNAGLCVSYAMPQIIRSDAQNQDANKRRRAG
jgi:hypothetical protein